MEIMEYILLGLFITIMVLFVREVKLALKASKKYPLKHTRMPQNRFPGANCRYEPYYLPWPKTKLRNHEDVIRILERAVIGAILGILTAIIVIVAISYLIPKARCVDCQDYVGRKCFSDLNCMSSFCNLSCEPIDKLGFKKICVME